MIVSKKYLRSYIRDLLESVMYDSRDQWYASNDSDWPAPTGSPFSSGLRSRYAIFIDQPEEYYGADPNQMSHGGYSHALKHAYEIMPNYVLGILKKISKYINNLAIKGRNIYKVSKRSGESELVQPNSIKPGDVLNTLDWINDAMYYDLPIAMHYKRMARMSEQIYELYWDSLRDLSTSAIDVSDEVFPDISSLINFLETKPIIKFYASFKDKPPSLRILDTSNSLLFGSAPDGRITTFFMQEKKPNRHSLSRSLSFIAPIKRNGSPSATMVAEEYSNLRNIAAMAVKGEL